MCGNIWTATPAKWFICNAWCYLLHQQVRLLHSLCSLECTDLPLQQCTHWQQIQCWPSPMGMYDKPMRGQTIIIFTLKYVRIKTTSVAHQQLLFVCFFLMIDKNRIFGKTKKLQQPCRSPSTEFQQRGTRSNGQCKWHKVYEETSGVTQATETQYHLDPWTQPVCHVQPVAKEITSWLNRNGWAILPSCLESKHCVTGTSAHYRLFSAINGG